MTSSQPQTQPAHANQGDSTVLAQPELLAQRFAYGFAIFASAFLLFQVEPLIAKIILPWFGGSASVWTVCLLFFQVVLLLGYLYAHLLTRVLPSRTQGWMHAALLVASILAVRILPRDSWKPAGPEHPAMRILVLLCVTVGLPYFLLSTASPLLQTWYAESRAGASPYRFYALSNAGSMLALVSYPMLVEPFFSNSHQAFGWEVAYGAVALLCGATALFLRRQGRTERTAETQRTANESRPGWKLQAVWVALAACGSALLLSVTNHISQNIASVPFLWILPLSLYLLSFILCFDARGWYRREWFLRMLGIALGAMTYALEPSFAGLPWKVLILLYCVGLFVCCMFCHGELARLKPHPGHLTSFYLMISLGGAIGAVFVSLLAPRIFSGYYELEVGMGLCAVLVLVVHFRDPQGGFFGGRRDAGLVMAGLVGVVLVSLFVIAREQKADTRLMVRNFYGVLRVLDEVEPNVVLVQGNTAQRLDEDPRYRKLMNGTIDHGLQYLGDARRRQPTTYYGRSSGGGIALRAAGTQRPLHVGAIGLGIGTVAEYGRHGDDYTFYEINPLVVKVANQEFTFLRDSEAKTSIVLGDARLSLERELPQGFDVLVVDAFSGDSIPVHLLTREAFELYFSHLKADGVVAVHVSNQYLDLQPVVAAAAKWLGKEAVVVNHEVTASKGVYSSSWILVGNRSGFLGQSEIEKAGQVLTPSQPLQVWTDNYSSLWRVLK
ncbi:MAG TPA: fused MFS/spermidine synthase [Candidatus Acidoferrales bacterium]|nr:fused MFS/spermidine synthase [Candidatus Acidoferrales bacterium]